MFSLPLPSSGAQLTQVSFLTSQSPAQTFSAGLSTSLLGHIFQSQCVCSLSPACLPQQLPDLQRESLLLWPCLPGCSFDASAKTEAIPPPSASQPLLLPCRADTSVCAATEQTGAGMGSQGCCGPRATLGSWQGRALPGWSSLETGLV